MHEIYIVVASIYECSLITFFSPSFFTIQTSKAVLSHWFLTPAELKILITFVYYIFLIGSLIAIAASTSLRGQDGFTENLREYLTCEAVGITPGRICERSFQSLRIEIPVNIGVSVLGLYPVANLLYVLNIMKIKEWIAKKFTRK